MSLHKRIFRLIKVRRFTIVSFVALLGISILLLSACEDLGFVGGNLQGDETEIVTDSIQVGSLNVVGDQAYTGKLRFLALGHYDDQLFGELNSVGLIKPSIDTGNIDAIGDDDTMSLRLVLDSRVYGDSTAVADFEIYRVNEFWRGNEIRFGDQISFDTSQKVGEFSVAQSDTILVDLDESWVAEYKEFLEMSESNRDSLYRNNFHGLAIAAVSGSSKVIFPSMQPLSDEESSDTEHVRFVVNNEDEEPRYQTVLEWGSMVQRTDESDGDGQSTSSGLKVHNTLDSFLEVDLDLTEEKLSSRNLANVELVLYQDQEKKLNSLPPGHVRPPISRARIHVIDEEPISDAIFNSSPTFVSQEQTSDNSIRFDITDYANIVLFSTLPEGKLYLSIESINGIFFSTIFHSNESMENFRPKIIVTSAKRTGN